MKPIADSHTLKIVYDYFQDHYKDQRTAITAYNTLKLMLTKYDNHKLVSFGNMVFVVRVENQEAEFHIMGQATSVFGLYKDIHRLINHVRTWNVRSIYSYGNNDPIFEKVGQRLKLDIKQGLKEGPDGRSYNYYRLEF